MQRRVRNDPGSPRLLPSEANTLVCRLATAFAGRDLRKRRGLAPRTKSRIIQLLLFVNA